MTIELSIENRRTFNTVNRTVNGEVDQVTDLDHYGVQEYFAYPEKFLFFELSGLDLSQAGARVDILFLLRSGVDKSLALGPQTVRLNRSKAQTAPARPIQ